MKETIHHNISIIHERINKACKACGRDPSEVQLLLATKTVAPTDILHAFNAGELLIGENKVQELSEKFEALQVLVHETHFIGHLQSNKIKTVIKYVDCIESVDKLALAERLEKQLAKIDKTIDILIQVNSSSEESKFGCTPAEAPSLVEKIALLPHLRIKGLMTIGLFSAEEDKVRACFKVMQQVKQAIVAKSIPNVSMESLSMGMSNDLEIAIAEGATIIRVGTAIFGKRIYADTYYWNEHTK